MLSLSDFTINEKATLLEAVEKIALNRSRAVIVLSGEKVIGVISEGDILRSLLRGVHIHGPISSLTVHSFKYLTEKDIEQAYQLVKKHLFTLVPVVDSEFHLVDVITLSDILESLNCNIE